jgi:regulation of enolase protein 1 (concanavalin A-like superfamily)
MRYTRLKVLAMALGIAGLTSFGARAAGEVFINQDVGEPAMAGSTVVTAENITVVGGGSDIWGTADQFHYYYTTKEGGFDAVVRISSLTGTDAWCKAEIMAREAEDDGTGTLVPAAGDRHLSVMTTRIDGNGVKVISLQERVAGKGADSINPGATVVPVYPQWLRLKRLGDVFHLYCGQDGVNWTELGSSDTSTTAGGRFADKLLVGIAVTGHSTTTAATCVFDKLIFNLAPPEVVNASPADHASYVDPSKSFTFTVKSMQGVPTSKLVFKVNGEDKSSALTFTGTDAVRQYTYAGPFVANMIYKFEITATDAEGIVSTVPISWDTFKQDNFLIEAEDFNYDSGKYNDNPGIGSLSPYISAIGTPLIDEYDPVTGGNHDYRPYDTDTQTGELIATKTMPNEVIRKAYADAYDNGNGDPLAIDYAVGWIDSATWLNYTRTFPAGTYQMSARIASSGGYGLRFDWVTSSPTVANQTTFPFGTMTGPAVSPGTTEIFGFAPLTDAFGTQVVQRFTAGVKTMRFNKVSGDVDLNFFQFVSVADPGVLTPYVSSVSPAKGATGISPFTGVEATIADRDTKVVSSSVQMVLDGTNDLTATLQKTAVTGGLKVAYSSTNILVAGSVHTVTLIYADNAATANKFTNSWQFTVQGGFAILPTADAKPIGSGQTSGFTTRLVKTSTTDGVHTLAWVENILKGAYPVTFSGSDSTSTLINYNGNGSSGNFANDTMFSAAFGSEVNDASFNDFATETVTYLELKRGYYRFGVNSDDNFWVTEGSLPGNSGRIGGIALGQYDSASGRGVADTTFDFVAPVDGVYPFRLTFENGDGGFGFEWFSVDTTTGVRTLINDTATAGAIRAYRFCSAMPQNVVSIVTNPPATLPIGENSKLVLSAAAKATLYGDVITNNLLFSYYWTLNGQPITDTDTKGIHGPTLSIDLAKNWQAGTYQCEVSLPGFPSVKTTTAVTVVPDTTAPTLTKSQFSSDLKTIVLTFSEPMDINTLIAASFQLDGGLTLTAVTPITDPLNNNTYQVVLTTSLQTEGKAYHLTVNGAADPAGNKVPTVTIPFSGFVVDPTVKIVAEFYDGISTGSADLYTVTSNAKYQAGTPDRFLACTDFETPTWENGSYYGGRLAGVVTAPETGDYTFYVTSDDYSQLFVSSDENPGNWIGSSTTGEAYAAAVTSWTNQRDWADTDVVASDPIPLVAGHKYYIMALWYEGSGGDGCSVGWKRPSSSAIEVIPGSAISGARVNPAAASIQIGKQPVDVTVVENRVASFSLTVTNATSEFSTNATPTYQWQRNGVNVASNGNSATYSIARAQIADSGTFQCVIHVPGLSVTSAPAVLTVTADTAAPVVASAGTLATAPTTVGVLFDELVESTSATTIANYTVSEATVTNVIFLPNGKSVALSLDKAVVSGATVKVTGVKDLVGNVSANTTGTIVFNELTATDVGTRNATNSAIFSNPIYVGSTVALGEGEFTTKAGGSDIWDNADGFHFAYKEVSGDFETKVRVESLLFTSTWSKAGLMVRESLEAGSRNYNTVVDPTEGANVWEPNYRAETNGASANVPGEIARVTPVTYPNAWIKLTRVGQVITSFKSTNGVDWIQLAGVTNTTANPFPAKMLVGLCATAHDNGGTNTVAEFRDFTLTTGGTPVEPPTFTVSRVKPNLVLTWDAAKGAGFSLYSASAVTGPWALESTAPTTANGVVTVTLPTTEDRKFFRLQK